MSIPSLTPREDRYLVMRREGRTADGKAIIVKEYRADGALTTYSLNGEPVSAGDADAALNSLSGAVTHT